MAITKEIRESLLGCIVAHEEQGTAELTSTGMLKTRRGLIIQPASGPVSGDLHTGTFDTYTPEERRLLRMDEADRLRAAAGCPAASVNAAGSTSARGSRRRKSGKEQLQEPEPVLVRITLQGAGEIPSQYVSCSFGNGVAVLGLNRYSYVPAVSEVTPDGIRGVIEFPQYPGVGYVFPGYDFTDSRGVRNIILVQIPAVHNNNDNDNDNQEVQDDGQEIQ